MSIRKRVVQPQGFGSVATEAFVGLVVAADHVTQLFEAVCKRHGITVDQYNVLRILRGVYPGGYPRSEVTHRLMRRAPDVSRLLDRLERRHLVERSRSMEDRRLSVARITKSGLALLERIDPEKEIAEKNAMAPLGESQLRQLARLLDRLIP
ncbi:MAG: MarR family transcriptional regulator [Gemmatimonadales bacterium]|nr:MarR family transcriptional regulator [Gemmatimonadales bacterium]MBA3554086.1 MarR family transcriptional regulator [Gemmatimonadales bacterium]